MVSKVPYWRKASNKKFVSQKRGRTGKKEFKVRTKW